MSSAKKASTTSINEDPTASSAAPSSSSSSSSEAQVTSSSILPVAVSPMSPLERKLTSTIAQLRSEVRTLQREKKKYTKEKRERDEFELAIFRPRQKLTNQPHLINLKENSEYYREFARFYASLGNMPQYHSLKFVITSIERIENESLAQQFAASNEYFTEHKYHQHGVEPIRHVYHGTHPGNIDKIVKDNLSMEEKGQVDSGWFGAGIYFSRHADYCMMYYSTGEFKRVKVGEAGKLLQVDILPGRQFRMKSVKHGAPRTSHYDSHISPNEFEYVLFDSRHILPRYVISFEVVLAAGAKFDSSIEKTGEGAMEDDEQDNKDDNNNTKV